MRRRSAGGRRISSVADMTGVAESSSMNAKTVWAWNSGNPFIFSATISLVLIVQNYLAGAIMASDEGSINRGAANKTRQSFRQSEGQGHVQSVDSVDMRPGAEKLPPCE